MVSFPWFLDSVLCFHAVVEYDVCMCVSICFHTFDLFWGEPGLTVRALEDWDMTRNSNNKYLKYPIAHEVVDSRMLTVYKV